MIMLLHVLITISLCHVSLGQYEYGELLQKSILFYDAQRSGPIEDERVPWRKDSTMEDGLDVGRDLVGGWFDAGDHVKFNFPLSGTTTLLAWSILEFEEAYSSIGELDNALNSIRVPLEYLLKCSAETEDGIHWAQVGNGYEDHSYWGRPEDMVMDRPSWQINTTHPGSDLAGETVAAMAAGALVFAERDEEFANQLEESAKALYNFAYEYRGKYSESIAAQDFYGSVRYEDELCAGAVWLYRLTDNDEYLQYALQFYEDDVPTSQSWDEKMPGAQMMMYIVTGDETYLGHVQNFLDSWRPGGDVLYTPAGLAWWDMWGPLRYSANTAFIAVLHNKYSDDDSTDNFDWAKGQIDYMLGDNPYERSYVVGFGTNPPVKPHHRSASCDPDHSIPCDWFNYNSTEPNPAVLYGALVGGPDENDFYEDRREDYVMNEVACDYNAGFQGALSGIVSQLLKGKH